jgi:amidase
MNMTPTTFSSNLIERRSMKVRTSSFLFAAFVGALSLSQQASAQQPPFPMEASIFDLREAVDSGRVSSSGIVDFYLKRIQAYDRAGPELNSLITVNEKAATEAKRLDDESKATPSKGPLYGIPVILKDNMNTADIRTTGGALALQASIPPEDSFVARKLRAAGAIILAKANLGELAFIPTSRSSVGGQPHNPYDLTRHALGSSGGSAIAVTSNFAAAALGTDTVDSIRGPAAITALVGLRPTTGLVSRAGIIPNSHTQDTAGPITRNVRDAAIMLDAIAGYDPNDPVTAGSVGHIPSSYASSLRGDGLKGKRIGVLRGLFTPASTDVNAVIDQALKEMQQQGAEIVELNLPPVDSFTIFQNHDVEVYEYQADLDRYLAALRSDTPVKSMQDIVERGQIAPEVAQFGIIGPFMWDALTKNTGMVDYKERLAKSAALRDFLLKVMADNNLDAFAYPAVDRTIPPIGEKMTMGWWNGIVAAVTGMPAIVVPAGFSAPTAAAPKPFPVGIELMARPWAEPTLFEIAYSYEQATHHRRPPDSVPPL